MRLKNSTLLTLLLAAPLCAQNADPSRDFSKHLGDFKAETMKAPLQAQDHAADIRVAAQKAVGMTAQRKIEIEKILQNISSSYTKAKIMLDSIAPRFQGAEQQSVQRWTQRVLEVAQQADELSVAAWSRFHTPIAGICRHEDSGSACWEERARRFKANDNLLQLRRLYIYGNLVPRTIAEENLQKFATGWEITISEEEYKELKRDYSAQTGLSKEELDAHNPF